MSYPLKAKFCLHQVCMTAFFDPDADPADVVESIDRRIERESGLALSEADRARVNDRIRKELDRDADDPST